MKAIGRLLIVVMLGNALLGVGNCPRNLIKVEIEKIDLARIIP